ncbi:MAG: ATP-dependent 6-phosphofructokinase [Zetaproteobacteria bacterium]|nr:ATP-dependent 6-phosphofructokinase [Zetaproteobacteria bacterium]
MSPAGGPQKDIKDYFQVYSLGEANLPNPVDIPNGQYIDPSVRIPLDPFRKISSHKHPIIQDKRTFELAGPRQLIYFQPEQTRAAIVSCGGLCPGINTVIRTLVMQLHYRYGCRDIWGIRYGYQGLRHEAEDSFVRLNPENVSGIQDAGGSILGSSRGHPSCEEMVERLIKHEVQILFTIGGDGTQRGAEEIFDISRKKGYKLSVVGIPKTIDNDIAYVRKSFGYETAVSIAAEAIRSAHNEAVGYRNGISLVKLMGRHSGYIAASATVAAGHANFCLVPEVPFSLYGRGGLLEQLAKRLEERKHAVIVVAEGAGQNLFEDNQRSYDDSGNVKLENIGEYLRHTIVEYFKSTCGINVPLKYIDPSYLIRSAPAGSGDQLFCNKLAGAAAHAAMAGKSGIAIGYWHGCLTHVPFVRLRDYRQMISPGGSLWFNVIEITGQPAQMLAT